MIRGVDDIIIKTTARILIPFIQLYALYVIMHGHYSPGGGFQGGVILGASIVLYLITHGLSERGERLSKKFLSIISSMGVIIYAGVGFLSLILLSNYLDYSALAGILNVTPPDAQSIGILIVEIGVAITVMTIMVLIFIMITTGKNDEE